MATVAKKRPTPGRTRKADNPWPARLYALRQFYGDRDPITQEEAAGRISASVGTWRNWEQGRRKVNSMMERLLQLAFPEFFSQS